MKRLVLILIIAVCTFFVSASHPAHAAILSASEHVYCNAITENGTSSDPSVGIEFYYQQGSSFNLIQNSDAGTPSFVFFPVTSGSYSFTYFFPALPAGTPINGEVYGSSGVATFANWDGAGFFAPGYVPCAGTLNPASVGATFFTPNDKRVDGRPGDRVAVYCVVPDLVQVLAINNSATVGYAFFKLEALSAAGAPGLTLPVLSYVTNKPDGGGTISVQLVRSMGQDYFYVAWNGGKYNATGLGDYKKMITSPTTNCGFN